MQAITAEFQRLKNCDSNAERIEAFLQEMESKREVAAAEAHRRTAERLGSAKEALEHFLQFGPDRVVTAAGRQPVAGDLWWQWAVAGREAHRSLIAAGCAPVLHALPPGESAAHNLAISLLRLAGEPGKLGNFAGWLKRLETKRHLRDVLGALRAIGEQMFSPPPVNTPSPAAKQKRKRIDDYEADLVVKRYLDVHSEATIIEVHEAVDMSVGRICRTHAWRRVAADRKAAKPPPKKSQLELSDVILAMKGKKADPASRILAEDTVWDWLLEQASPEERARLHALPEHDRRELIRASAEQYAEFMRESRKRFRRARKRS